MRSTVGESALVFTDAMPFWAPDLDAYDSEWAMISPFPAFRRKRKPPAGSLYSSYLPATIATVLDSSMSRSNILVAMPFNAQPLSVWCSKAIGMWPGVLLGFKSLVVVVGFLVEHAYGCRAGILRHDLTPSRTASPMTLL